MQPKKRNASENAPDPANQHLRTSIGRSVNTRPLNKHKRRDFKPYRGQGK
jgi:hypothetical protein